MPLSERDFFAIRSEFLVEEQAQIISLESSYMDFLLNVILLVANDIYRDFGRAIDLMPFWVNYPPVQRGRSPRGTSIPWGEVGEKSISSHLIRTLSLQNPAIEFPGLPLGGDIRFSTSDVFVHMDIKMTGPNDRPDEIVASPHQISGDGYGWYNDGIVNSPVTVSGERASMAFQPELPPFYILDNHVLLCLTYFLKVVYSVQAMGQQPLDYLELVCVPNGLLLFDGPMYGQVRGMLIPGKDEKDHPKKRLRVRLNPLAQLASWRSVKIVPTTRGWQAIPRFNE
jgi:hypothetical protein